MARNIGISNRLSTIRQGIANANTVIAYGYKHYWPPTFYATATEGCFSTSVLKTSSVQWMWSCPEFRASLPVSA